MKRIAKLEALPLLLVLAFTSWLICHTSLPFWMLVAALFTFGLLPAAAGIFYGLALGRAQVQAKREWAKGYSQARFDRGGEVVNTMEVV